MDPGDFLAPEDARFHDVGLLHGAELVAALAGQIEGGARDATDFGGGVALGVHSDAPAFVVVGDAARFAEIDAGGQFSHDHDVQTRDHVPLQRREIRKRVEALGRSEVGE